MNVNTTAIRRVRDSLLARGHSVLPASHHGPESALDVERRDAILRRVEPFAETMYLVMMADSELAEVERQTLVGAFDVLTAGAVGAAELGELLAQFDGNAQRDGSEARLQHIGARLAADREDRETAFTLASVVALADEEVDPRENHMLALVREYFGVSERRAAVLLGSLD